MRLPSYIVGLAVIASSFIAINPVEAQSGNLGWWYRYSCREGECFYLQKIGGSWPFIKFRNTPNEKLTMEADCQQRRIRYVYGSGRWIDVKQGTNGEAKLKFLCR